MKRIRLKNVIQTGALIIGCLLLVVGIEKGGFDDTLHKAVRICYECIG